MCPWLLLGPSNLLHILTRQLAEAGEDIVQGVQEGGLCQHACSNFPTAALAPDLRQVKGVHVGVRSCCSARLEESRAGFPADTSPQSHAQQA